MNTENKKVMCHTDCPVDGVQMKTDCIRTDFIDNPGVGEAVFRQNDKSEAHISASVEIGILSIRDLATGVMLTVSIQDAMELLASALDSAKEEDKCLGKLDTAENAEKE